jgi:hypothetical protein
VALSAKTRKRTATVRVNGEPKFPMPDKKHARLALQYLGRAKGLTAAQKQKVRARANKMLGKTKRRSMGAARGRRDARGRFR